MHVSSLYLSVTNGEWPPRTFSYTANGTTRTLLYYLVDGIYTRFEFFVSPFPDLTTEVEVTFNRLQEALRKDVERLYAVLTARFHMAMHPAKYSTVEQMVTVTKAVAILHNMVTEKRRDGYVSRTRMATGGQAAGGGGAAGPVGGHGGAAGNAGGGNGGAAAAGGDGSAGGNFIANGGAEGVAAAGRRYSGVCTVLPPVTPAAAMEERPPPAVMDPPAALWVRMSGLGELRRRRAPPSVRRPAAAGRQAMWVRTAAPPATPATAMEERPPPAVMDLPAAILLRVGGLGELRRRRAPPAVRRPAAAAGRRYSGVCTVLPPVTLQAAMEERPPPAVMDPPAAIWVGVGGLGEFQRRPVPPAVVRRPAVVLRECRTMETALWGAVIPPPPLRPPLHTEPGDL